MKKILLFIFFFFLTFINVRAEDVYLKDIIIDGTSIEGFDTSKTEYTLNVDSSKDTIKVVFDYDNETFLSQITGNTGVLNYGTNTITITLTRKSDSTKNDKMTYTLNIIREDNRSGENSLASLTVASKKVVLSDKLAYDVLVDNSLTKVEVIPVLKDLKASFVSGYGERKGDNAVLLSGESTKVEVKIQAENGDIKTYTINIIKSDYKNNDATLKTLTIDKIDFNFKPTTYEYNLSVEADVENIIINAISNDTKAKVDYDQEISLQTGVNEIKIIVTAEDLTIKEYKLNITRKEEVPLVANIIITGIDFNFQSDIYDYEIKTEETTLDFQVTLNSETATVDILNNENLTNGSVVKIQVKDDDEVVIYNFKIINETITLDSDNETVETNKIKDFLDKYEMYIGLGSFGLGLFSLLIAILTKSKKSQIM